MRLSERTIVVTGGSGGIGREMAAAFVAAGASVVIAGRTPERLETAVESFEGPGEATGVSADVRDYGAVERLVAEAESWGGPVDVLVNNAGVTGQIVRGDPASPPVAEVDVDTWRTVIETNLTGAFHCARAVLPGMLERDAGRVLHVSSGMGIAGKAGWGPYAASKFGLEGLAECIALEVEDTGVDSLLFRPPGGGVHTEARERIGMGPEEATHRADVVREPAVELAAGAGENGGRYKATPAGDLGTYSRDDR